MKKNNGCFWCGHTKFEYVAKRSDDIEVMCCLNCSLMQVAESPEDLEEFYTEGYYNSDHATGVGYDDYYTLMNPLFLMWQSTLLGTIADKQKTYSLLDVGCATGNLMEIIKQYHPNMKVSGIDISDYAIEHCQKKGLVAEKAYIQDYRAKGFDFILSLETLEHLDNLKVFVEGVNQNLKDNGAFLFYVPSVARHELEDETVMDVRLSTNLEHLIYFTPEFFETQFSTFFDKKAYIQEIVSGYGRSIVGLVTNDSAFGKQFQNVFKLLTASQPPMLNKVSDNLLKDLIIISAKFYGADTTRRLMNVYESGKASPANKQFTQAIIDYHDGSLASSIQNLLSYYNKEPADIVALKILLANEAGYNKILLDEISVYSQQVKHPKLDASSANRALHIRAVSKAKRTIQTIKSKVKKK